MRCTQMWVVLMLGLLLLGCDKTMNSDAGSAYECEEGYTRLRSLALGVKPSDLGLTQDGVLVVLVEMGYEKAVATLIAVADGSASLYFSNGGGIIGAGGHKPVAVASKDLVSAAGAFVARSQATEEFPLPAKGRVRFYFVTPKRVRTAEGGEDELGKGKHPFSQLFAQAHVLIAAIREHSEQTGR
jgi:hypothetical protein